MIISNWSSFDQEKQAMLLKVFASLELIIDQSSNISTSLNASPWMTRAEAAEYAKYSTDTIDNWIAEGYIQRAKLVDKRPGGVLIDRKSLEKFLRSKLVNPKKRDRKMAPSVPGGYRVRSGRKSSTDPVA